MASPRLDSTDAQSNVRRDISPGPAPRRLSRSPHPYWRRRVEPWRQQEQPDPNGSCSDFTLLTPSPYPSDRGSGDEATRGHNERLLRRDFRSPSDSGTEADDESYTFLKGLPAPPVKLRKGLRDTRGEGIERSLTPLHLKGDDTRDLTDYKEGSGTDRLEPTSDGTKKAAERTRRSELIRKGVEFSLVACIGGLLLRGGNVIRALRSWHRGTKLVNV
jgi:hypothetical protein